MTTYFLFGKYSPGATGKISAERTKKAGALIKELGGQVKSMYALLGKYDIVLIVELPGLAEVVKASVALSSLTGIRFITAPAIPVEEFDKLVAGS